MNTMTEAFSITPVSGKSLALVAPLLLFIAYAAGKFPVAMVPLGFFGVILIAIFVFPIYSSRRVRVLTDQKSLRIQGELYGRDIDMSSLNLATAKIVNLDESRELRPRWRTNGVGLPGYQTGWFKLKDGEKALLFVTDPTAVVYIPTGDGYSLLMSVSDAPRFLASIRKHEQVK